MPNFVDDFFDDLNVRVRVLIVLRPAWFYSLAPSLARVIRNVYFVWFTSWFTLRFVNLRKLLRQAYVEGRIRWLDLLARKTRNTRPAIGVVWLVSHEGCDKIWVLTCAPQMPSDKRAYLSWRVSWSEHLLILLFYYVVVPHTAHSWVIMVNRRLVELLIVSGAAMRSSMVIPRRVCR